jgi:hypothetical protein
VSLSCKISCGGRVGFSPLDESAVVAGFAALSLPGLASPVVPATADAGAPFSDDGVTAAAGVAAGCDAPPQDKAKPNEQKTAKPTDDDLNIAFALPEKGGPREAPSPLSAQ